LLIELTLSKIYETFSEKIIIMQGKTMSLEHYTPLLKIREMLMYFKLNLSSQSFIEENVPSIKKLLTFNDKEDIIREGHIMINTLFERYDLDLDINVFITEDMEHPTKYFLNIEITHEDLIHEEVIKIEDSKFISDYEFYKNEIILDKEY